MVLIWALNALVWTLALVLLAVFSRRRSQERAWLAWDATLTGDDADTCRWLEQSIALQMKSLDTTLHLAEDERALGNTHEAARVLACAAAFVESYVPTLQDHSQKWRDMSRALLALYPVEPPRLTEFRLWRLSGLAALHRALHAFTASSRRRFELRLILLAYGFRLVARAFTRTARRALYAPWAVKVSLRRARLLQADLGTLNRASLATLHALVVSLRADAGAHAA